MRTVRNEDWLADTESSYDTVAASYAKLVRGALDGHAYLKSALSLFEIRSRRAVVAWSLTLDAGRAMLRRVSMLLVLTSSASTSRHA